MPINRIDRRQRAFPFQSFFYEGMQQRVTHDLRYMQTEPELGREQLDEYFKASLNWKGTLETTTLDDFPVTGGVGAAACNALAGTTVDGSSRCRRSLS